MRGFTLIEFIVVIVILGLIAATALPRYFNAKTSAHRASVAAMAGAFRTGVTLVRLRYRVSGFSGPVNNLAGFGLNNLDINSAGYPTDTTSTNPANNNTLSAAKCARVWSGVLEFAPSIGTAPATTTDYRATLSGLSCVFTYRRDTVTRSITYNTNTGVVTSINP